ncbi:MAG: hypothetical protein M3S32_10145 [Acidobacteriota bacterium]|nr:hypothetical protein [Acidobacteriota bacterium]
MQVRRSRFFGGASVLVAAALFAIVAPAPARAADAIAVYACQGFDEPMNRPNIQIGRGRVLPLRAKLVRPDGTFADETVVKSPPTLSLKFQPENGPEVDKTAGMEVRDYGKGNRFVWDQEAHWKFDLGTGNLPDDGKYTVTVLSGDAKEYRVDPACKLTFRLQEGK